jgi:hypothetical protein
MWALIGFIWLRSETNVGALVNTVEKLGVLYGEGGDFSCPTDCQLVKKINVSWSYTFFLTRLKPNLLHVTVQ